MDRPDDVPASPAAAAAPAGARVLRNAATPEWWFHEGCHITEWLNTPDDPLASVARARVAAGCTTRWHALDGTTERYVILQGAGRVEVGDLPAQQVGPGDVVLIPPQVRQRITAAGDAELVFLAVCTPRFRIEAYRDLE